MNSKSVLVLGCGSIGRRHAVNLLALGMERVAVCDVDPQRLSDAVSELGVKSFDDYGRALQECLPDAVVVCTPPYLHVPQALEAVRAGASVFVEKPISHSLDGVDGLIAEAKARRVVLQVGYNFRFHPGLQRSKGLVDDGVIGRVMWARAEIGQYLPEWRPDQDYRQSYTAHASMGGGIILDASHEIDYLIWMFGDPTQVYCVADILSNLEVDAEDTASMILRFPSGCVAEVHLDFVQRARVRNCKLVGTEGTIIWDFLDSSVTLYGPDGNKGERIEDPTAPDEMYRLEMQDFLARLDGTEPPGDRGQSARRTLEIALAARESASTQQVVSLLSPVTS